ncbi:thioredoxin domain-containing protein [Actinospica robiniae]|uniref:thioredoxin domain-containing protein n=1 Tax=Actinospica robiniae TaxID=304901 RepID=UPI0003F5AA63|nr:thioredoxin domain-containing protein [Actinospica robiniae]
MNRLASATSPYLLQHADNPVDWHEWGDEAFAEARRRDVPLLISIGYSSCHWCHVMAHESFEDPTTASAMNAGFVCVKVDREERPDVDAVYMTATQAMTGHGGWPMTVFADTEGRPFYCGTYFPPRAHGSVPGFLTVLAEVARAWTARRAEVTSVGETVAARMGELAAPVTGDAPDAELLAAAVARLAEEFSADAEHGGRAAGFGTAPKFPPSMTLLQLLRHHRRTGSAEALEMVTATCTAMARGGIYDQLGGGFSRYAVDAHWGVPHFEKMLYDNALLLRVYALLWRVSPEPLFRRIAEETAAFLIRELGTVSGGFASALDADTDGVEGLTYVWTYQQLVDVLGDEDAAAAARVYGVSRKGNFEHGASVLRLTNPDIIEPLDEDGDENAPSVPASAAAAEAAAADVERVAPRLRVARAQRPQPHRDDKIVASWNGLAISGLVEASLALDRPDLLAAAVRCGNLLAEVHSADGRLVRTSRDGRASTNPGVLEDYGCVAEAFALLHSATGDHAWLAHAEALLATVRSQFRSEDGLHDTAADASPLYFRPSDPTDNASPSGASAAAAGFAAFALAAPSLEHLDDAYLALAPSAALAEQAPRFAGYGLAVAEALLAQTPALLMCPGPFCPAD